MPRRTIYLDNGRKVRRVIRGTPGDPNRYVAKINGEYRRVFPNPRDPSPSRWWITREAAKQAGFLLEGSPEWLGAA